MLALLCTYLYDRQENYRLTKSIRVDIVPERNHLTLMGLRIRVAEIPTIPYLFLKFNVEQRIKMGFTWDTYRMRMYKQRVDRYILCRHKYAEGFVKLLYYLKWMQNFNYYLDWQKYVPYQLIQNTQRWSWNSHQCYIR